MSASENRMRLAFVELTQGRMVTIDERLMFEAGYMAGQKAMQERCVTLVVKNMGAWDCVSGVAQAIQKLETT